MAQKPQKPRGATRPPRIRVPNNERVLFTANNEKFVGTLKRLSITGGSAVLTRDPFPAGALAEMNLNTVHGRVTAQVEFLQSGAEGIAVAQAFRFLRMGEVSLKRFTAAIKDMERAGFSDAPREGQLGNLASQGLNKLRDGIRKLSDAIRRD